MEKLNKNDLFNYLIELINIPSYGVIGNNHKIINYLKDIFKELDVVENTDTNGNTHLLVGVNCKLNDLDHAILLSGHIDTVKESDGHHPNAKVDGDCIEGLGSSDMKAFFAVILSLIDELKCFERPIVLSITSDEETELMGVRKNIEEMKKRNISVDFAIIGEPTNLDYYASSRGNTIYVSVMNGKACHSSTPELGINAIELESEFIGEIKKINAMYPSASICITSINGGRTPSNIVPDGCSICFGVRTTNRKDLNEIFSYLSRKHDEISNSYKDSKLFSVLEFPPFERKKSFFTKYALENGISVVDASYSTEAGYFQSNFPNADMIIYGPGNPNGIHKAGESIPGDNLIRYREEFMRLLNSYLAVAEYDESDVKKYIYKRD